MRDEFSQKTKDTLAKRVAWRCSFRGCLRLTVGPGHKNSSDVTNLGEAAHICAASKEGPRYNMHMTASERKSIDNGIWMCRQHARLIDSDFINYSPATLRQWKILTEEEVYSNLYHLESDTSKIPTTLVSIGKEIVFDGVWKSVDEGFWKFQIHKFIIGQESDLREFDSKQIPKYDKYIVVETQGDGRLINGQINWQLKEGHYEVKINVENKIQRTTPYELCDISAEFIIEDNDLKLVKGVDCAKQIIQSTLSTNFGELFMAFDFGSYFSSYYWRFRGNPQLLLRLIKIEVIRLISIPYPDSMSNSDQPPLNFINRVLDIEILDFELKNQIIPIRIKLEWGDGKYWEDVMDIYIMPEKK